MKKIISIILELLIIVTLYLSLTVNKDFTILYNKKIINSKSTINKYKDYRFLTLDLSKAKETRFSISDKTKEKTTVYYVNYGDKNILVELLPSTVLTNKVDVMYMKDNQNSKLLKVNIKDEEKNIKTFTNGYYTNLNLEGNIRVLNIKFYICIAIGFITILFMLYDLFKLLKIFLSKNKEI